jgi:23S rRNA pseudouridine1911/1915/1917 synthase
MHHIKEKISVISPSTYKCRLDKIFTLLPDYNISRSQLQRLIKEGHVNVNGKCVQDISHNIFLNDVINIEVPKRDSEHLIANDIPLDIVYEDDYLAIINKPAALTVHPGAGNKNDTLVNALMYHYKHNLSSVGGDERPGIVHRLDRNTSGLLVVAKDDLTHAKLSKQMQDRQIKRKYWAIVWNMPYKLSGTIITNIDRHKRYRTKMAVSLHGGKQAITHYKLLKTFCNKKLSLLECVLDTGRTHQIRVHLSYKKMPVVCDPEYCNMPLENFSIPTDLKEQIRALDRQALHAINLSFIHPMTETPMDFYSAVPKDIGDLLAKLEQYQDN